MDRPRSSPDTVLEADGRTRRSAGWWIWVGYWTFLFVIMHVPIVKPSSLHIQHADKVVHFIAYFVLTVLGGRCLLVTGGRVAVSSLLLWGGVYCIYAAVDECLQALVGRTMSLGDWIADVAGIGVASLILLRMRASATSPRHT